METLLLSVLLLAGSSAAGSDSESSGARAQAVASARIISGEAVTFDNQTSVTVSGNSHPKGRTVILPMAHSKGATGTVPQSKIVEFH